MVTRSPRAARIPCRLERAPVAPSAWSRRGAAASWRGCVALPFALALALPFALAFGCAPALPPPGSPIARELALAYDDNRGTAVLTFPNLTYESILRFALPEGNQYRPLRLRLLAAAAGKIAISFYDNTLFDSPGKELRVITRELVAEDLSNGKDGRWVVEELRELPALTGVVWVGVRKLAGDPALWTSAVVSGQVFLRDRNPAHELALLPVKRTPLVRLELRR